MVQPPTKEIRMVQCMGRNAEAVMREVCTADWIHRARTIKANDSVSVFAGSADGRKIIAKVRWLGSFRARIGKTRIAVDIAGWRRLKKTDIRVPEYLGKVRGITAQGNKVEMLLMECLPGHSLLWEIASGRRSVRQDHALASVVGNQAFRMTDRWHLFNKDHKPSNILVAQKNDEYLLSLIDLDGITRYERCDISEMLAKMAIECIGCGVLPRRALLWCALRASLDADDLKPAWREIEKIIAKHGDPTPKDDPLEFDRRMMGID